MGVSQTETVGEPDPHPGPVPGPGHSSGLLLEGLPLRWPSPRPLLALPCGSLTHPSVACARSIFLIDHAWTCRVTHARQQLQQVPGLLHRMANLMGVEFHGELPSAEAVDLVLEEMWKFNQTYQLAHGVSGQPGPRGGRWACATSCCRGWQEMVP